MRQTINLNLSWKFHWGEAEDAFEKGYDDRAWQEVTLPHDWSVEHPFDQSCSSGTGYLPGGVGWYRKRFSLPPESAGKRVFVTFNGVYQNSSVWINTHYLGMRPYGYSSFTYELTDRVQPGENMLCLRAEHIHLADSRWFTGAGIYRDVTLFLTEPQCLRNVFARTERVENDTAFLRVSADADSAESVKTILLDADGSEICAVEAPVKQGAVEAELQVPMPRLWSPDDPVLYTLRCQAICDHHVTDEEDIPFGIRTAYFDADRGLLLNGIPTRLKGVCIHHDAGALGAAVPSEVWERRLRKLKQVGCNAIRFSHNPPDPNLLALCDRMGFLAIDEAFDEWEGCKNKWWQGHNVYPPRHYGYAYAFPQWHERDLADLVRRDRNHPCVILWSIGNEIDYPNDPYVHPSFEKMRGNNDTNKPEAELLYNPDKPDAKRITAVARELARIVRENDNSRPVTAALALPELANMIGLTDVLDVVGYNYCEALYRQDHKRWPDRPLLGSENGTTAAAWLAIRDLPYIAGQFLWTGVDFLGEAKGWPVRVSQTGLLDMAGYEKPLWHQRKALWTDELCAALSVTDEAGEERYGWDGAPDETLVVRCLTNGTRARLMLNDREIGDVMIPDDMCGEWRVPFKAGRLYAVVERNGESAEASMETPGKPAALRFNVDRPALPADGQSIAQVEVTLVDGSGRTVVLADAPVTYQLLGNAKILGIENGDPADLTCYASPFRKTRHGRAIVYVRAGRAADRILLAAWREDGIRAETSLQLTIKD